MEIEKKPFENFKIISKLHHRILSKLTTDKISKRSIQESHITIQGCSQKNLKIKDLHTTPEECREAFPWEKDLL